MYNLCLDFFSIDKSLLGLLSAECPRAWMSLILFKLNKITSFVSTVSFTIAEPPLAENGISSAFRAVFAFISST